MQLSHQLCTNWSFFRQQFARVDKNGIVSIAANHRTDTQKCHLIVEKSQNRGTQTKKNAVAVFIIFVYRDLTELQHKSFDTNTPRFGRLRGHRSAPNSISKR